MSIVSYAAGCVQHPLTRGQLLSVLIAGTGFTSSLLASRGVFFPTFQCFLTYVLLSLHAFRVLKREAGPTLSAPWYYYLCAAVIDIEANFLVVKAYSYTSITSIMLLDCFAIPMAMLLSFFFLEARYTRLHFLGVCLCVSGLVCTVYSDTQNRSGDRYPHAWWGDILCLIGAALYAGSNVFQEFLVKIHNREEYLALVGCFGGIVGLIQSLALELEAITGANYDIYNIFLLLGFTFCMYLLYANVSIFLQESDAALFNLSLLTSDLYAILFSYFAYGYVVRWLYYVALVLIATGLYTYHVQHSPHTLTNQFARLKSAEDGDCESSGLVDRIAQTQNRSGLEGTAVNNQL